MVFSLRHAGMIVFGWVIVTMVPMLVFLSGWLPFGAHTARPEDTLLCFHLAQLFFVLFVWPFLLPKSEERPTVWEDVVSMAGMVVLLMIVALPLAVIAVTLSDVPVRVLLKGQALVFSCALAVASVMRWGFLRRIDVRPWTVFVAMTLSSLPPLVYYFLFVADRGGSGLVLFSPAWAMVQLENPIAFSEVWLVQSVLMLLVSAVFLFTPRRPSPRSS